MKTTRQTGGNINIMRRFIWALLIIIGSVLKVEAQVYDASTANRQEIFLQLDRPFYLSGEKVWFTLFNYNSEEGTLLAGKRFMNLHLLSKTGEVVLNERIKIINGRTAGQFVLPSNLNTDEYLINIGFSGESVEQFLYRKKLTIYNRSEVLNEASNTKLAFTTPLTTTSEESKGINTQLAKSSFGTKEKIEAGLSLETGKGASLSILVRPVKVQDDNLFSQKKGYEQQNLRTNKILNFQSVQDHPYLLVDLKPNTELKPKARPYIFIPETHQVLIFFKTSEDTYSLDLTDISGGMKSFYFSQFVNKPFIPSTAKWDYEKEKYKNNLVPFFEGEMSLSWVETTPNFSKTIADINFGKPEITEDVVKYGRQQSILEAMYASGAYRGIPVTQAEKEENIMKAPTLFYRKASDYEMMNNLSEYLFEIVSGIRVWNNDNRKDVRVLFGGEQYPDAPLFLVDGIPTRDTDKVLRLPIEDLQGAGVIKYNKDRGQSKYNKEARSYSAFAGSGIIVIHLKPGSSNPFRSTYENLLQNKLYIEPEAYPNPNYSVEIATSDAPDLRHILLWQPIYEMNAQQQKVSFYTSEVPGTYELVVQGFTRRGERVFLKKLFTVTANFEE